MFCPQCKAEYRVGFIRCSDCDAELVDHLPVEMPGEAEETASGFQMMQYPALSQRVLSIVIDQAVILVAMLIAAGILDRIEHPPDWLRVALFIALWGIYEPVCTTFGCTAGNYVIGIRVRRVKDIAQRISIFQAYVRYIVKVFLGWLSFFTINMNKQRRAIHDLIAGTVMIKLLTKPDPRGLTNCGMLLDAPAISRQLMRSERTAVDAQRTGFIFGANSSQLFEGFQRTLDPLYLTLICLAILVFGLYLSGQPLLPFPALPLLICYPLALLRLYRKQESGLRLAAFSASFGCCLTILGLALVRQGIDWGVLTAYLTLFLLAQILLVISSKRMVISSKRSDRARRKKARRLTWTVIIGFVMAIVFIFLLLFLISLGNG